MFTRACEGLFNSRLFKTVVCIVTALALCMPVDLGGSGVAYASDYAMASAMGMSPCKDWDTPLSETSDSLADTRRLGAMSADDRMQLQGDFEDIPETSESFKFILRWGEQPLDLDSHLDGYRPDGFPIHVYFSDSSVEYNADTYCALDYDDTDSYGPETVKDSRGLVQWVRPNDRSYRKACGQNPESRDGLHGLVCQQHERGHGEVDRYGQRRL